MFALHFSPEHCLSSRIPTLLPYTTLFRSHVQITVAETVGLESRADFYDGTGALRDMVQNHMLQLLALVAMEPPTSFEAEDRKSTRLNSSHLVISYAVFCLTQKTYYCLSII